MPNVSAFKTDPAGEFVRDEKGKPVKADDWIASATDMMGRRHNPKLHGKTPQIDAQGYLKVQRRDAPKPMSRSGVLEDTLAIHRQEGYTYYYANAKPGRIEAMEGHDWERVQSPEGVVQLKLPDNRVGAEHTILMRKPTEWYQEDQVAKEQIAIHNLDERTGVLKPDPKGLVGVHEESSGVRQERNVRLR